MSAVALSKNFFLMDLKIVKHSIDLMLNAAMRINSFNIDNVHYLTVYDVDILRELVDDLKKNISDLKLDDIVLNSNSVDESRFLLSKVLFIIEPYYSDPSHKDLIHIDSSFDSFKTILGSIELEIKGMTLLQSTYLSYMESLYYFFDFLHKRISSSLSSVSRCLNVYNTFNPAPESVLINSNCSLNVPKELDTEEAQEVLQRAVNANILDKGCQCIKLTIYQKKRFAELVSEELGIKSKWKTFEDLWGIKGLAQVKMYEADQSSLKIIDTLFPKDIIDKARKK